MSVTVDPGALTSAAGDLQRVAASMADATAAAAAPTTAIPAAAADEVSTAIAGLFESVGARFQAVSDQARAFEDTFVSTLRAAAGAYLGTDTANTAALAGAPDNVTVPITMQGNFPTVGVSVGGGPAVPMLLDTGSAGLVVPFWDVGWKGLGLPTGLGVIRYGNGVGILYADMNTTVNFGGGAVTSPTSVQVGLLPFPTSVQGLGLIASGHAFGPTGHGILGIGPNVNSYVTGSHGNVVTTALPGRLSAGELIDIPHGQLTFGPNTGTPITSVTGAPITQLDVQVGGYDPTGAYWVVNSIVDSGGNHGSIPGGILGTGQTSGYLPPGTVISVATDHNQTPLYSWTTTEGNSPIVTGNVPMNTGLTPFALGPVYISNSPSGVGSVVFDYPAP